MTHKIPTKHNQLAKTGYNGLYFDGGIRFVDQKHFCRKTYIKSKTENQELQHVGEVLSQLIMVKLLVEKQILLIKKKQNGWMNLKMHLVCYSV